MSWQNKWRSFLSRGVTVKKITTLPHDLNLSQIHIPFTLCKKKESSYFSKEINIPITMKVTTSWENMIKTVIDFKL